MLHETGSTFDDESRKVQELELDALELELNEEDNRLIEIQTQIATVMSIQYEEYPKDRLPFEEAGADLILMGADSRVIGIFKGELIINSEQAYAQLDTAFAELNVLPVFRRINHQDIIYAIEGRPIPAQGGSQTALILFLGTIFTVLLAGTLHALSTVEAANPGSVDSSNLIELWRGIPYAVSILLILGGHELGHYFMARYHGVASSLPYFLPSPFVLLGLFGLGTFGATIRLREPMKSRKILFDIGVAGPLVGMVFAVPILFIGLATSDVHPVSGGLVEGNSILYALAKIITFGRFLPSGGEDVFVNQLAWAGWVGLLFTGVNLIPLGQLDGGHVMYSLIGKHAQKLYYPVIIGLFLVMTLTQNLSFLIILALLIFLGRLHAVPLDDITPLDPRRRVIAVFALVLFALVFVPIPLSQAESAVSSGGQNITPDVSLIVLMAFIFLKSRRSRFLP